MRNQKIEPAAQGEPDSENKTLMTVVQAVTGPIALDTPGLDSGLRDDEPATIFVDFRGNHLTALDEW